MKPRPRIYRALVALCLLLTLCACPHTIRPGAVDGVDSEAFNVLGTWQFTLDQLKVDCPSGPTSPCPQAKKDAINRIGETYNLSRQSWLSYRAAVKAGQTGDREALSKALAALILAGDDYRKTFTK